LAEAPRRRGTAIEANRHRRPNTKWVGGRVKPAGRRERMAAAGAGREGRLVEGEVLAPQDMQAYEGGSMPWCVAPTPPRVPSSMKRGAGAGIHKEGVGSGSKVVGLFFTGWNC